MQGLKTDVEGPPDLHLNDAELPQWYLLSSSGSNIEQFRTIRQHTMASHLVSGEIVANGDRAVPTVWHTDGVAVPSGHGGTVDSHRW